MSVVLLTAICDGRSGSEACTTPYGRYPVKLRSGATIRESGGTCDSPETCSKCADGSYSDGPYCRSKYNIKW